MWKNYKCVDCNIVYDTSKDYNLHLKSDTHDSTKIDKREVIDNTPGRWICEQCGKLFTVKKSYWSHTNSNKFNEEYCGLSKEDSHQDNIHKLLSNKTEVFMKYFHGQTYLLTIKKIIDLSGIITSNMIHQLNNMIGDTVEEETNEETILKDYFDNDIQNVMGSKLNEIDNLDPKVKNKLIKMKKEHNKNKQNKPNKHKELTIAETFVGCGGAHLGFQQQGFKSCFVNDIWDESMITLRINFKDLQDNQVYLCDIKDITKDILLNKNVHIDDLDVLFGGVVCCGFSMAGNRNPFDERNYLYLEQMRLVKELQPRVSIIENVKGFMTMKLVEKEDHNEELVSTYKELLEKNKSLNGNKAARRKANQSYDDISLQVKENDMKMKDLIKAIEPKQYNVLDRIKSIYSSLGYKVYTKVLNASDYGSYTKRERLIVVAVRNDINKEYKYPEPTHSDEDDNLLNKNVLNDALNLLDLEGINSLENDIDNRPMKHNKKSVDRFSRIPEGKNIADVIDELPEELKISSFYSRGNTQRLDRKKCTPTLVPGHSNFPIHPWEHRSITVREAGVITGFPIDFKFHGYHGSRCTQIGNAVPVHLANAIAKSVIQILE